MVACRLALKFALALAALFAQSAQAFIDPPRIVPTDPKPGEVVSVNIRSGVCDAVLNVQDVTRAGNTIRVLFFGVRYFDSELCNLQIDDTSFPIGSYPSGSYLVQADLMYGTVGGGTQIDPLGVVPFTIQSPATAVPAPINAPIALLALGLGLLSLAAWKYRSRSVVPLLIGAISLSPTIRAQDVPDAPAIQVLLSTAPGAPTPDDVAGYFCRAPRSGPLPLQALASRGRKTPGGAWPPGAAR